MPTPLKGHRQGLLLASAALVFAVVSCAAQPEENQATGATLASTTTITNPSWFLAAEEPQPAAMDALITGVIVVDVAGECVRIETANAGPYPLVFPVGTRLDVDTRMVTLPSGASLSSGDRVEMGGGSYDVQQLTDAPYRANLEVPPESCWGSSGDQNRWVWEINSFTDIVVNP